MRRALVAVVFLVSCATKSPPPAAPEPVRVATVNEVVGDATQNGAQVTAGQQLALDSELVVGDGRVELTLSWAGTVRVFPRTRMLIAAPAPNKADVRLAAGRVWALIKGLNGGSFEIESANAVAGVRGTELVVDASDEASEVYVVEGEVEVRSRSAPEQKQRVRAQQRTRVVAAAAPSAPVAHDSKDHVEVWSKVEAKPSSFPASVPAPMVQPPTLPAPEPAADPEPQEQGPHKKPRKQPKKAARDEVKETPVVATPPPPTPPPEPTAPTGPKKKAIEWGQPPAKQPLNWPIKK